MGLLTDKRIVLGVCGSIAAYKAADVASKLVQAGAKVDVILTRAATEFITPFTFRSLTSRPVYTDMFEPVTDAGEEHVSLARVADLILIAPATGTTLARIAYGLADDMLSLTVLASRAPLVIAPAMDAQMWEAAATQENVATLKRRGATFVGPDSGRLASGFTGTGRLVETETVLGAVKQVLAKNGDFAGTHIVVTAGGTREAIDPIRYITNLSSGKMGHAVAEAARDRGAGVTLVSATDALPLPYGVERVLVGNLAEMREAVLNATRQADALVMAAAVSDFKPANPATEKIKKNESGGLTLELVQNPDFLHETPDTLVKVAFAAETENLIENARLKPLRHGRLDLICANDVTQPDAGFGVDTNRVTIIDADGGMEELPLLPKYDVAQRILDRMLPLIHGHKRV
jgi:phosphopantothenoylcysteine decarboxylase/phosphopantothenate--cysteine ligase